MQPRQHPRLGRPPRWTLTEIIEAAVAITSRRGLDTLTMKAVAEQIGASEMALYRYVDDRRQLEALTVDAILGGLDVTILEDRRDPRERLHSFARALRQTLLRHPGAAERLLLHGPEGPAGQILLDRLIATLLNAGVPDHLAPSANGLYTSMICGAVAQQIRIAVATDAMPGPRIVKHAQRSPTHPLPALERVAHHIRGDFDQYFDYAIERTIDGILAGHRGAPAAPRSRKE